jgi:hypothetical protein
VVNDLPDATDDETYRVGYRHPPLHTRFKPGNHANPWGRGGRARDEYAESVRSTLASKVEVREGGTRRTVSLNEANILSLFDKAKRGNVEAANRLLDLYEAPNTTSDGGPVIVEIFNALPDDAGEYLDREISKRGPPPKDSQ